MFERLLIANRGEIAVRVIKTAKELGLYTIAVYADPDAGAMHVSMADEAYALPGVKPIDTYLDAKKIIEIAKNSGADAIHPGYGFLSENADFAKRCEDAGIIFVGPSAKAIDAMGSKSAAKSIMNEAGVPVVPGYHGTDQTLDNFRIQAEKIGYPILLKAALGGGGKGMSVVTSEDDLAKEFDKVKRESKASFNDDRLLIEKYLEQPRHIEVQVFGDHFGEYVYLFERDCSIQRRHQKVLEEAPGVGISETLRQKLGTTAVKAASAIDYVGAGTIEFLLDKHNNFYFMEMNTRLQVEHPVTEMITGQDLVAWQLKVAAREPLPETQETLTITGHAIEVRVYAEDPDNQFLPATGVIEHLNEPKQGPCVRIDTGVRQNDEISVYYDPMIAKLICWDTSRVSAIRRLRKALNEYHVVGLKTNISFLSSLSCSANLQKGEVTTAFIEQNHAELFGGPLPVSQEVLALATLCELLSQQKKARTSRKSDPTSPWHQTDGWQLNLPNHRVLKFLADDNEHVVTVQAKGDLYEMNYQGMVLEIGGELQKSQLLATVQGKRMQANIAFQDNQIHIAYQGWHFAIEVVPTVSPTVSEQVFSGSLAAPMPGTVVALFVEKGAKVKQGDALVSLEAMKMEHTIVAPESGEVVQINFKPGDMVEEGADLLKLELDEEAS